MHSQNEVQNLRQRCINSQIYVYAGTILSAIEELESAGHVQVGLEVL